MVLMQLPLMTGAWGDDAHAVDIGLYMFSLPTRNSATAVFWQALNHALRGRCMFSSSPEDIARSVKKVRVLG